MRTRRRLTFLTVLLLAPPASAEPPARVVAPPSLEQLLRRPQTDLFSLSPNGQYIAATTRVDDRMLLAILDRATLKPVRVFDPDRKGAVDRMEWVSGSRLFLMTSVRGDIVEADYQRPWVLGINADGTRKRAFFFPIIDTLADDDEHVLVADCGKETLKGCVPYARLTDADGSGVGPKIVDAPAPEASMMSDPKGRIVFSWAWNDDDVERLWLLRGGQWELLNDEAASGVESVPVGVSRDGRFGFLRTERTAGPDVIERVEIASGHREVVLSDPELDPAYIVWSADRVEPIGAAYGLGVPRARFWDAAHPDARVLQRVEQAFPDDAVTYDSGSRDGRFAVLRVWSDRDPGSFYLLDRRTLKVDLMARMMPGLDIDALARSQPICLAARDGTVLHGYLTLPLRNSSPPPLVVLPHGGPFGIQDDGSFDREVQMLAANGFAVLRVNFRGSGGFGRAFEEAGYRQWGGRMQDDVVDATRWALASGKVDPARVCIWGSSYGGYAALVAAVQNSDLFRCAVDTAGLSDLALQWKWGDTHRSRYGRSFLDRSMGSDPKDLYARSPVHFVDRIRIPLLVVHGVLDERVSFNHVRALRDALDKAKVPYEGYFPRNEMHGIDGDAHRLEYYQRVLDFLRRSIGPAPATATQ